MNTKYTIIGSYRVLINIFGIHLIYIIGTVINITILKRKGTFLQAEQIHFTINCESAGN